MTAASDTVGWGVVAPGGIAALLASDLALVPDAEIVAVGSRDRARAEAFAARHGGTGYGSYDELLTDPRVDVVYVASPHALHLEHATLALAAGKHVLCEKPLTLDRASAVKLVATAREHDRFLMEAMWSACHPVLRDLTARLRAGDFGVPRQVSAAFCFNADAGPGHRLRDPALGGGALLDLGIYPLTLAHLALGEALELRATGVVDENGVDLEVAIAGRFHGDAVARLGVAITSWAPMTASIATDRGWIEVASEFHHPPSYTLHQPGREPVVFGSDAVIGQGFGNEVAEVNRCVREGLRESPLVPHEQTLLIMGQLDELRRQVAG